MTTYIYDTSKGAGVPGLPHTITDEEAKELGLTELLKEAIENGAYKPAPTAKSAPTPKAKE